MLFAPIHQDVGRSSGLALATRGAGGVRITPHAHCVQPRRTLPEADRVAEFGALEEAREMCSMVSPELPTVEGWDRLLQCMRQQSRVRLPGLVADRCNSRKNGICSTRAFLD